MNGKKKCSILKNIRRDIAKANGIELIIPECTHKGDCLGTCPRCEAEVRYLERGLAERRAKGLKIALAGISAGAIALSAASCDVIDDLVSFIHGEEQLQGDMAVWESDGLIDTSESTESTEAMGEVTALAGDIAPEDYVLDGDIAFPADFGEDYKGLLLAPEEDTDIGCPEGVHAPGIEPREAEETASRTNKK